MKITHATITGEGQRLGKSIEERGEFATPNYRLTGRSLHLISQCPSAWQRRGAEDDQHTSAATEAVWSLLVMPARVTAVLAVRPEKLARLALSCPKCGATSKAKHCMHCDTDREPKPIEITWSRAVPECRAWEERAETTGHTLISTPEFKRAQAAAEVAMAPACIHEMLAHAQRGVMVRGSLATDDGRQVLVTEPILALPPESAPDGDSIYLLFTVSTSALGLSDNAMEWRGAATRGALALDLVNSATEGVRKRVRFILAGLSNDAEPGYCELSTAALQAGRQAYQKAATSFLTGCESQVWPGHDHDGRGNVSWRVIEPMHLAR